MAPPPIDGCDHGVAFGAFARATFRNFRASSTSANRLDNPGGAVKAQELENVIGPKNNRPLDQADAGN